VTSKIKVLYVLNEFMYGSKVRRLCDLVSGLDKDKFQPEVCSFDLGDEATGEVEKLNVPMFRLRLVPEKTLNPIFIGQFLKSPFQVLRKKYDIVHSLCYQSVFTEPLIIKLFSRAKFIYTKTNLEWENHYFNWQLKSRLADRIVSISCATDRILIDNGFSDKIVKIFSGLDLDRFKIQPEKRKTLRDECGISTNALVYGCAAQIIELKGHLTLIEAFNSVAENHGDAHLMICGGNHGDAYYQKVLEAISTSPHTDRIHMLGTVSDMVGFYSAIDCFVLPSWNENLAYVYIEAMSCGRPVIGCRDGGTLDIIMHDETGYFVGVADAADLAKKMKYYVDNRSALIEHGNAGRLRAKKFFSKEAMVRKHENLYESLLSQ